MDFTLSLSAYLNMQALLSVTSWQKSLTNLLTLVRFLPSSKWQKLYQLLNLMITRILITKDQYRYYLVLTGFLKNLFIKE